MLTRRIKRRLLLVTVLLGLLGLLGALYVNYLATRELGLGIAVDSAQLLEPPTYLYSFNGPANDRLVQPIGVYVDNDRVYVADAKRSSVDIFNLTGQRVGQFQKGKVTTPLYIAKNPKDGNVYISDRRKRSVEVFTPAGKWVRTFDPKMPKSEIPSHATDGITWIPIALTFADDGTMYVTDLLKGHRVLIFDPSGKFVKGVGNAAVVPKADQGPELFQFPNSVKVVGKEVWVADSNNRRLQIFDRSGKFLRFAPVNGLPRGFAFLGRTPGSTEKTLRRLALVDTLAQDCTIFDSAGKKLVSFGSSGVLEGQFSYPNDLSVDGRSRIFVSDTNNGRIQVWGWPEIVAPIPMPRTAQQWGWCLSPLLLLPLLALRRRQKFVVTPDFVGALNATDQIDAMLTGRKHWLTWEQTFGRIEEMIASDGRKVTDVVVFDPTPHSDSDARALVERFELPYETAALLAVGQRGKVFCTEDADLRRLAKTLEIDVCNAEEYVERFGDKRRAKAPKE